MIEDLGQELLDIGFGLDIENLDKESILEKNVFEHIFAINDPIQKIRTISSLREKAKQLKIVRAFNEMLKFFQVEYSQTIKSQGSKTMNFTSPPIENLKCGEWECKDTGVSKMIMNNFKPLVITACPHPILPTERIINVDSEIEKVKIEFFKDGKWKSFIVDRNSISNNTAITKLANLGIEVNSNNSKDLVTYLADVINLNTLNVSNGITHLGWYDNEFVPYTDKYKYDGDISFKGIYEAVKEKGDYEKWKKECIELRKKSRILHFIIASSLASPLIELLNINPFIVHLWGKSGTGKTVALMIAMSIWGNPAVGKLVKNLNSTNVGFERTSSFLRNIPFAGDELQSIKVQYKNYDELIYKLTQGEGKNQGTIDGGVKEQQQWHCTYLTTGEEPITSESSKEGVKNRVIEIEENELIVENGNHVVNLLKENYGFAGKKFIEEIKNVDNLKEEFENIQDKLLKKYNGSGKQTNAIALIMLADKIASEIIFNDNKLSIEDVSELFAKDIDEADRIYSFILDWFYQNINKFKNNNEIGEVWGKYDEVEVRDGKKITVIYIIPKVLKDFLNENNINFDGIKSKLFDKKIIEKSIQGKYTQNTRINGTQMKSIKIIVKSTDNSTNTDESIPF